MAQKFQVECELLHKVFLNVAPFIAGWPKPEGPEEIHRHVLGCLLIRLRSAFSHLYLASTKRYDLEYLAWSARNLMELAIWSKYAASSQSNRLRIKSDQLIDLDELQKVLVPLGLKYNPGQPELQILQERASGLAALKTASGLAEDDKHLNVGKISKEVGMASWFYPVNGYLSKFVHPTAFSILLDADAPTEEQLRNSITETGLYFTAEGLRAVLDGFGSCNVDTTLIRLPTPPASYRPL